MEEAFRNGEIPLTGTAITQIMPPMLKFKPKNEYALKKQVVLKKFDRFFERFHGLI